MLNRPLLKRDPLPFLSPAGLAAFFLFLICIYAFVASITVTIVGQQGVRLLAYYYNALLFFLMAASYYGAGAIQFLRARIRWKNCAVIGAAALFTFGVWFYYRKPLLFYSAIWFDEATQFFWRDRFWDTVKLAAVQQQPPLDYYFSGFARHLFGASEFAILFHAVAFGIFGLILFSLWLYKVRLPLFLFSIPLILFAGQSVLLQYSTEARPISLGVFFSIFVLIFLHESFVRGRVQFFLLFPATTLLLLSLGLQPIFFLFCLALSTLPVAIFRLKRSQLYFLGFTLLALPLLLFAPILHEIYMESKKINQFVSGSFWSAWKDGIASLQWSDVKNYSLSFYGARWFLWVAPVILLVTILCDRLLKSKRWRQSLLISTAATLFLFTFPLVFQIFWNIINWSLYPKYFVLWITGLICLIVWATADFLQKVPFRWHAKGKYVWTFLFLGLGVSVSWKLHNKFIPPQRERALEILNLRPDWRKTSNLSLDNKNVSLFISVPYSAFNWEGSLLYDYVSGLAYAKKDDRIVKLVHYKNRVDYGITFDLYRISDGLASYQGQWSDLIFLLRIYDHDKNDQIKDLVRYLTPHVDAVIFDIRGYIAFKLNNQDSPIQATKSFYKKIIDYAETDPRNFYLVDSLLGESLLLQDKKSAIAQLALLKKVLANSQISADSEVHLYVRRLEKKVNEL